MLKQIISKMNPKFTVDITQDPVLKTKCYRLLRKDGIKYVGIINNMGNLISGGFSKGGKLLQTDGEMEKSYIQTALEISMRRDFDDSLGKISHIITNRDNVMTIAIPRIEYTVLIFAEPTSIAKEIIAEVNELKFFQSEV
jgi:hypothetical protein